MFRQIVEAPGPSPYAGLSTEHPRDLLSLIDACWEQGGGNQMIFGRNAYRAPRQAAVLNNAFVLPSPAIWDHLIYAYLVENTRIYEIFRRVIWEYRNGEKLGPLTDDAMQWLRNTEELFYTGQYTVGRSAPVSSVGSPDWDAARRNAYFRLFGYDLNHGVEDNRPAQFAKPQMANKEFGVTLEILLHEVWKGVTNARNTSGKRDTDDAELANLTLRLFQMLTERKSNGKLVREEFWSVTAMSWLHMAVEENSPIVLALQAQAASAEERLRKIGTTNMPVSRLASSRSNGM